MKFRMSLRFSRRRSSASGSRWDVF